MNLQDHRTNATPTESAGETTESLWCPAEATEPVSGNVRDDLVEKLALQLDQWLHANGCRLTTTPLAPAAPAALISTPTTTTPATHNSSGVPPC